MNSLNATVELKPTAGSKYSGVIEEYHEVKAFLLAQRPASIRVIGQAPIIGKTVFDMASDGETFHVSIPSKNKFLIGSVSAERAASKPIENLRPQHLLDALLWPEVRKEETVLFEEFNEESARYYVLTVLRGGYQTEILRKIWFDRSVLQVARLESFGPRGILVSDTHFSNWQPVDADGSAAPAPGSAQQQFPRSILIERPHDDYRLDLQIAKITLNAEIPAERFKLEQPAGVEVIHVGEPAAENQQPEPGRRPQDPSHRIPNHDGRTDRAQSAASPHAHVHRRDGCRRGSRARGAHRGAHFRPAAGNRQAHRRHRRGHHGPAPGGVCVPGIQRLAHAHQNRRAPRRRKNMCSPSLPRCCNSIPPAEWKWSTASSRKVSAPSPAALCFCKGRDMEGPDDLLVDDWAAKAKKLKVGDTYSLLNHDWHVVGIIEHGKGARLFVPLATLQDLVGAHDKASIFLLRCTRPEHTEDVMEELRHVLPGYTIRPLKDFLSLMTATNIPGLKTFIHAMIALAIAIGLLVIFLTMYTTVIERTRDIGVLKSLGANRSFIIRTLLAESAALCIIGIAAGIGLSYAVRGAFLAGFPTLSILITPRWIAGSGGHRARRGHSRRQLSRLDGQPQRPGRSPVLRLVELLRLGI